MKKKSRAFFRRNKYLLLVLILATLYYGYNRMETEKKLESYHMTQQALKEEIESLGSELERLQDEYEYSQTPEAIEKLAREKLKMVKPNEVIYLIRRTGEDNE